MKENKQVEIIFESNKETIKRNLIQIYDVINKIALTTSSKNKTNWFYKEKEINNIKKNNGCNFLQKEDPIMKKISWYRLLIVIIFIINLLYLIENIIVLTTNLATLTQVGTLFLGISIIIIILVGDILIDEINLTKKYQLAHKYKNKIYSCINDIEIWLNMDVKIEQSY